MSKIEMYLYRIATIVLLALIFQICENTRLIHEDLDSIKLQQTFFNKR
jgi:hypothetical protein